jgi:hypothetical protein
LVALWLKSNYPLYRISYYLVHVSEFVHLPSDAHRVVQGHRVAWLRALSGQSIRGTVLAWPSVAKSGHSSVVLGSSFWLYGLQFILVASRFVISSYQLGLWLSATDCQAGSSLWSGGSRIRDTGLEVFLQV